MENGRCACGLLRAYPLPREFPRPGGGRAECVGAGSPPLPHTRCRAEPGIPAHCWASPFANQPTPQSQAPKTGSPNPEGGPAVSQAGGGAPGQEHESWGAERQGPALQGHPAMCSYPTLPSPRPFSLQQAPPLLSLTFPSHVPCSICLECKAACGSRHTRPP